LSDGGGGLQGGLSQAIAAPAVERKRLPATVPVNKAIDPATIAFRLVANSELSTLSIESSSGIAADHDRVVAQALAREADFEVSKVSSGRDEYRKSILLDHDRLVEPLFRSKIQGEAVDIARSLGLNLASSPEFESIECQVTAHLDGGFYHAHTDTGSSETQERIFSYVYYFQSRPNAFFGGELKLYEPLVDNGLDVTGARYSLIAPEDNSIVFFPSHIMHEVLPTYVRSGASRIRASPLTDGCEGHAR